MRIDNRTQSEFEKEIKLYSKIELDIAIRICCHIYDVTNVYPELIPTGTDYSGKFQNKAFLDPDFKISNISTEIAIRQVGFFGSNSSILFSSPPNSSIRLCA